MKDITIRIKGKQYIDNETEDTMEFVTEGQMYERNGNLYYLYDECEFSGFKDCKTTLRITEDSLRMKRIGKGAGFGADLFLKVGERFSTIYKTQMGDMEMEVRTNSLTNEIDSEGYGIVTVDYRVSLAGIADMRNILEIEIMQ